MPTLAVIGNANHCGQVVFGRQVQTNVNGVFVEHRIGNVQRIQRPNGARNERRRHFHPLIQHQIAECRLKTWHPHGPFCLFFHVFAASERTHCRVCRLPRLQIHHFSVFVCLVKVANNAFIPAGLCVIEPNAEQIIVVWRLGADGNQQRVGVCALAGDDCVHKVGLRPANLSHLVKNCQRRGQAVGGAPVRGQGPVFHITRQANQFLARRDNANQRNNLWRKLNHLASKVKNQRGLFTAHCARNNLCIQFGFGANNVRQQNASNQTRFAVLTSNRQIGAAGSSFVIVNGQNELLLKSIEHHWFANVFAFGHF